ncbi:hypothetical protein IC582_019617 [Cucumis melo]
MMGLLHCINKARDGWLGVPQRFCKNPLEQQNLICSNSLMYRHFCRFGSKILVQMCLFK